MLVFWVSMNSYEADATRYGLIGITDRLYREIEQLVLAHRVKKRSFPTKDGPAMATSMTKQKNCRMYRAILKK